MEKLMNQIISCFLLFITLCGCIGSIFFVRFVNDPNTLETIFGIMVFILTVIATICLFSSLKEL